MPGAGVGCIVIISTDDGDVSACTALALVKSCTRAVGHTSVGYIIRYQHQRKKADPMPTCWITTILSCLTPGRVTRPPLGHHEGVVSIVSCYSMCTSLFKSDKSIHHLWFTQIGSVNGHLT